MQAETLLVQDVLAGLDTAQRVAMLQLAQNPSGIDVEAIAAIVRHHLLARFPHTLTVDDRQRRLRFNTPELARLFCTAFARADDGGAEDPVEAIVAAQARGDYPLALDRFRHEGGVFFMHFHGLDACLRVLKGFPKAMQQQEMTLVFAAALHALKAGSVSRARHLIGQRFGPEAHDLKRLQSQHFPIELRIFRFLMAMYEDISITDAMRDQLFDALGEVPLDDHLQRGAFYNAMLEIYVRRRELDAATELAQRAGFHYARANAHLLGFYIDIYQAILCLMRGAPGAAQPHAHAARAALGRVGFESPSDERILGLVEAVISYEQGDMESLVRFIGDEFDKFAFGEIWPTLAELAIDYGGNALAHRVSLPAARVFLDRWHVQEWRSNRFRLIIRLREVALLQGANRWQEASDLLTAVQSRVNRTWVEGAVDNLIRLSDPSEIGIALAWLRHLIWAVPTRPLLRDQLSELARNDHLTERQRITVLVWSAHTARIQRDVTAARAALHKAFETCARLGTIMPLVEESQLDERSMEDKRISRFVLASSEARETLRRMRAFAMPRSRGASASGLTRQEMRVLTLVAEGGTNKFVARQLGLSEVTVKFHLSNVFRKIGCTRRTEAIAAARTLGWVG